MRKIGERFVGRLRPMQRRRVNRLMREDFSFKEAREFAVQGLVLGRPYMRRMRRDRMRGKMGLEDWSDPWQMLRYYYQLSVMWGEYVPPTRKYDPSKPHRKLTERGQIDREHVKKQAAKYRGRKKKAKELSESGLALSGDRETWIKQLRGRIEETTNPAQRRQFEAQIKRLEERL